MSNVKVTINDTVEFDGEPGDWQNHPPDMFKDLIKPQRAPAPWMLAIALTMNTAIQADKSVDISVSHRSNRWEMKVEYA